MEEDDWQPVDLDTLTLADIDRAGVKNLSELQGFSSRDEGGLQVDTWRFRGEARLILKYQGGKIVEGEMEGVRFERLGSQPGSRVFVSAAYPVRTE